MSALLQRLRNQTRSPLQWLEVIVTATGRAVQIQQNGISALGVVARRRQQPIKQPGSRAIRVSPSEELFGCIHSTGRKKTSRDQRHQQLLEGLHVRLPVRDRVGAGARCEWLMLNIRQVRVKSILSTVTSSGPMRPSAGARHRWRGTSCRSS